MIKRLIITFTPEERQALQQLAEADFRMPREQVRWLIRQAAQERGLWPPDNQQQEEEEPL